MNIVSSEFVKGVMGTDPVLSDGIAQIAFVGRSNVGKSSVINSLVNSQDLVKTGKKPGKTTELNIFIINEDKDNQCYFVDLPGYGYAKLSPDQRLKIVKLINWYLTDSKMRPTKVVLVLDIKAGLTAFDEETIALLEAHNHSYIIVANKIDKLSQKELSQQIKAIKEKAGGGDVVPYSATKKTGVKELLQKLSA